MAWRLSLAIAGFGQSVLETYDHERRGTAKGVVEVAAKLVRSTLRTAEEYVGLVEKNAANITGKNFPSKDTRSRLLTDSRYGY